MKYHVQLFKVKKSTNLFAGLFNEGIKTYEEMKNYVSERMIIEPQELTFRYVKQLSIGGQTDFIYYDENYQYEIIVTRTE